MKHLQLLGIVVALALMGAAIAAPSAAQEKNWSVEVGADYATRYLFRGVPLLGENEVIVPHAYFTFGNLGIYYDGYIGEIPDFESDYREDDFAIDYTFPLGENFGLTIGAVQYMYNKDAENDIGFLDTYELYVVAAWDSTFSPTISYWQDMDVIDGGYLQVGFTYSAPLTTKASLDFSAALGVDFGYNLYDELAADLGVEASNGDLNDVLIGVDLPIQFTDYFSIHLMAQQSIALDVLDDLGVEDETVFTGGINFSF